MWQQRSSTDKNRKKEITLFFFKIENIPVIRASVFLLLLFCFGVFLAALGLSYDMQGSPVAEHRISNCQPQVSLVVVLRLSCPVACGIVVPPPGIDLCPLR